MRRRGNGEGTIYQRADGRWHAQACLPDGRRKSVYGRTRADVVAKLTRVLHASQTGTVIPTSDKQRVDAYLAEWLASARPSLKASTWTRYEQLVRVHAVPVIGTIAVSRLSPQHIQSMYARLLAAGVGPVTVRRTHAVLRRAFGQAERWGVVTRNVVPLADPPREPRRQMRTYTEDQVRAMLVGVADDRYATLYLVAVTTGMRQGELLAIRWRDVDLDGASVRVQSGIERRDGRDGDVVFVDLKTATARRRIMLTRAAVAALRRHRKAQIAARFAAGTAWADHDLVFTDRYGRPLHGDTVTPSFQALLARVGLPRIRFHDLRHTCFTTMLGRGVHPKIVSEMAGHASIAITLDTYSHVLPTMQEGAAAIMDQVLGGKA